MRTNGMENTHSKNRKHKSYTKQKLKSPTDSVDDKETHILSSVDRIRAGHLASTPVSAVGNIVDMQGSLDHGVADKNEEERNDSKIDNNKNESSKTLDNQSKQQEDSKDIQSKEINEIGTVEGNVTSKDVNVQSQIIPQIEDNTVKEDIVDQKDVTDEACESSAKQSVSEKQGVYYFYLAFHSLFSFN